LGTGKDGAAVPAPLRPGGRHPAAGWITTLYDDGQGQVWAGTHDDGLYRWMPARPFRAHRQVVTDRHSLADDQVSALFRDRVGTFWVGTWYGGVSRVDLGSGGFARIVREHDGRRARRQPGARHRQRRRWRCGWPAANTLQLYDPSPAEENRVWRHEPGNPNSLIDTSVNAVVRDRDGIVWVGGRTGITRFDPAMRALHAPGAGARRHQRQLRARLMLARDGAVWIATRGGLHRLDPRTRALETYRHDPAARPAWPTTWCARCWKTGAAGSGSAPSTASTCSTAPTSASATSATILRRDQPQPRRSPLPARRPGPATSGSAPRSA
jgi:hypothetical protein